MNERAEPRCQEPKRSLAPCKQSGAKEGGHNVAHQHQGRQRGIHVVGMPGGRLGGLGKCQPALTQPALTNKARLTSQVVTCPNDRSRR
jgi:hypothetical protein